MLPASLLDPAVAVLGPLELAGTTLGQRPPLQPPAASASLGTRFTESFAGEGRILTAPVEEQAGVQSKGVLYKKCLQMDWLHGAVSNVYTAQITESSVPRGMEW